MPSAKKRGGLGRGLNALVSEAEYETGGSAASASNAASETKLPIEDIVPNPNQPRIHFNETELRELSESIQEHGVLQPLLVRKHGNGYEIIAGERRYQASKLAGLEELPVIIKDVNDEEMLALALIENLQRSDLNPVEEAKGYRQLIDASGMTQEALSKAVSKSRSAITNSLRLLDLPEVVQQMIFEGKLTAGHARAILAVPYEDARIRLAEKVVAEGLSVRATENLAPLFSAGETPKTPRPATPQSFKKAARVLRQVFNTNVRVKILNDTEELANVFGGSYTIARRDLKRLSISSGTITGGEAQTVSSVSEVAGALGKNTAVTVSGEVSGTSNKIEVPAAQSPETPISIAFQSVASGAKIEFEDKATSGGGTSSVKDMTIALPETESVEVAPVVNVDMPNTTVTLSSNGGSTTIKEATASTAENTLVVDAGVTITKLIVKKGNVRVKKGATITAIERHSENSNVVKVFVESGAEYPDLSANANFEIVDAAIAEMEAVAKAGGNFILEQDVTLFRPLVVEGVLTLDLNGHSIKAKTTGLEQVLKTKDAVVLVRRGAQLTINDRWQ